MERHPGPVQEAETVSTFVVYQNSDGTILHTHHVVVPPDAEPPSEEAMVHEASTLASRITSATESEIAVLPVTTDELKPGAQYRVDPRARRLIVTEEDGSRRQA